MATADLMPTYILLLVPKQCRYWSVL